jgi:hypothetical protein
MPRFSYRQRANVSAGGGNQMSVLNLEDVIVEAATSLALSGECDLPLDNNWGGVDLVAPGYYENIAHPKSLLFTNGVRFAIEDNVIHIYKMENFGIVAHATFVASLASLSSVLVAVAKEWLA